jgi:hypothetical protein
MFGQAACEGRCERWKAYRRGTRRLFVNIHQRVVNDRSVEISPHTLESEKVSHEREENYVRGEGLIPDIFLPAILDQVLI